MAAIDDLKKWLVSSGVYERLELETATLQDMALSISSGIKMDGYCVWCKDNTTYSFYNPRTYAPRFNPLRAQGKQSPDEPLEVQARKYIAEVVGQMQFTCAREKDHRLDIWTGSAATPKGMSIRKIGQLPSPHDLVGGALRQYAKILGPLDLREMQSASICHATSYHVAAFVYLRRVFERRLEAARALAQGDPGWDDAAYSKEFFTENRIEMLRDHLPKFLVDNRRLYSILSKGIHQLSEEECSRAYDACNVATQIILDEEIEAKERKGKLASAANSLASLQTSIESGSGGGKK